MTQAKPKTRVTKAAPKVFGTSRPVAPEFSVTEYRKLIHSDVVDTMNGIASSDKMMSRIEEALLSPEKILSLKLETIGNDYIDESTSDTQRNSVMSNYRTYMARVSKTLELEQKATVKLSKDKKSCAFVWGKKTVVNEEAKLLDDAHKEVKKLPSMENITAYQMAAIAMSVKMQSDLADETQATAEANQIAMDAMAATRIKLEHSLQLQREEHNQPEYRTAALATK